MYEFCQVGGNAINLKLLNDQRLIRREVLVRRILDGLRHTLQLQGERPETPIDEVRAYFTDESARFVAPLAEAIEILEDIIFASDGCVGHRQCAHSMEPWQRARVLLQGKWDADEGIRRNWPDIEGDI